MYFSNCATLDDLKAEYRKLAMKWHPDRKGGDLKTMQAINAAYDKAFARLSRQGGTADAEQPEAWRDAVAAIINLDGIEIELVGSWVWVSGETKRHKDALKAAGYRWSGKRRMWYWRAGGSKRRWRHSSATYAELCDKYGCETVKAGGIVAA